MNTNNSRIYVSFNESDADIIKTICEKKKVSRSSLVRRVMEEWLEDYEDHLLARRAEAILDKIEKGETRTVDHEEMWKRLDTE